MSTPIRFDFRAPAVNSAGLVFLNRAKQRIGQRVPVRVQSAGHAYVGSARIAGVVTELGVPGAYPVRLYHRRSGQFLAETQSAADGTYQFEHLAPLPAGYFVTAHDVQAPWRNGAIGDRLSPEPG